MKRPYFESVRDVYLKAASDLFKLAAEADPETADPEAFLARGVELLNKAHEAWPVTPRQDNRVAKLRWAAKANTTEGRELAARIREKLGVE